MDTSPRYTLVGFVLLIVIVALAIWVGWLWRGGSKDKTDFYAVYFRNQSLSGLQIDSIVTMRGIKIGSVKTVAIQPKDIERVRVSIALDPGTPVRTDTRAVIARNLLTGLAGIDLIGSTQYAQPLVDAAPGDNLPVILEGQTGLDQFQQSIPEIIGKASGALDRFSLLLSDQNINSLSASLGNLEKASASLTKVDGMLTGAGDTLKSANVTFNELSEIFSQAKGKVAPTLTDLSMTIKEIRGIATGLSSDLGVLSRSLAATSEKLREPRSSVLGLPSGNLGPGEKASK